MLYKHLFSILCRHLNLNRKRKKIEFDRLPAKPAGIPVRTGWTGKFEFKFEFVRFRPVTGQTGPVYRNRKPAVTGHRSDFKTLVGRGPAEAKIEHLNWLSSFVLCWCWALRLPPLPLGESAFPAEITKLSVQFSETHKTVHVTFLSGLRVRRQRFCSFFIFYFDYIFEKSQ